VKNLSKKTILPGQTIGIIGGGQLGRMMALAARKRGYRIAVLDPTENSPCGQIADIEIVAPYHDKNALNKLASVSDVITYEFENIDYESLAQLKETAYIPQGAEVIKITQNRIKEKELVLQSGLNTVPFEVVTNETELVHALNQLGYPSVLKTITGGYDGKGQHVIRNIEDLEQAKVLFNHGVCILEKFISFSKEISVIISRSLNGETKIFPVAENIHKENILHITIAPARIHSNIEEKAKSIALKIAEQGNFIGTFAIEMFVTKDEDVLVNEIAPRPHNSGHYTIEACQVSQFEQHILAICNVPLGDPHLLKPAVMVNILGEHMEDVLIRIPTLTNWHVHFYGKQEAKKKRKMGHVTLLRENLEEALKEIENTMIWID